MEQNIKYMLLNIESNQFSGYSLFCVNLYEEIVLAIVDMTLLINVGRKTKIDISWDETETLCTIKSDCGIIQCKVYEADEISTLCNALTIAFDVRENDTKKSNRNMYQRIISLKDGPGQTHYVNLALKRRWVIHNQE